MDETSIEREAFEELKRALSAIRSVSVHDGKPCILRASVIDIVDQRIAALDAKRWLVDAQMVDEPKPFCWHWKLPGVSDGLMYEDPSLQTYTKPYVFTALYDLASLALLAQQPEAVGWQPISTAPKKTMLLLAAEFDRPGDWRIKTGYFCEEEQAWRVFGASWEPTRWMHQPQPPKDQEA
jgi:hypothetical protein